MARISVDKHVAWAELQRDIAAWAARNFKDNTPELLMLGLYEEIAELLDPANLTREGMVDALGDQTVYCLNLCDMVGIGFASDIANELNQAQYLTERQLFGALGLGCRAILKCSQGIRGMGPEQRKFHLKMALGLWFRWAQAWCNNYALPDMLSITQDVWRQVSQRDWRRNPVDAHKVAVDHDWEIVGTGARDDPKRRKCRKCERESPLLVDPLHAACTGVRNAS